MNDKIADILALFAEKLGTTTELLWGALLKQAPLAGVFDLSTTLLWFWGNWFLIKITLKALKEEDSSEEFFLLFSAIGAATASVISILLLAGIPTALAAFFNPEYWALMQLVKCK